MYNHKRKYEINGFKSPGLRYAFPIFRNNGKQFILLIKRRIYKIEFLLAARNFQNLHWINKFYVP